MIRLGHLAVMVFIIIISGFVITNLVINSNEPCSIYLRRRALRLFPTSLICLAFGILMTYLSYDALFQLWGRESVQGLDLQLQQLSLSGSNLIWHILAHIFLLQGLIPDNILYYSQMMFLDPAWSLSLEWQFYIVAPIFIAALRSGRVIVSITVVFLLLLGYYFGNKHVFGHFGLPSFLPGIAIYFAIGILTRLYLDQERRIKRFPYELVVITLVSVMLRDFELQPIVIGLDLFS